MTIVLVAAVLHPFDYNKSILFSKKIKSNAMKFANVETIKRIAGESL
jgi:hypothetical protein